MTKALIIHETGGPEVLLWEDYDPGHPGPGQAFIPSSMGRKTVLPSLRK